MKRLEESRAVGLRPVTLTSDEVQELTKRLDQPDAPPKRPALIKHLEGRS